MTSNNVSVELGGAVQHYVELEEGVANAADSLAVMGARGYSQYKEAEGDQLLKWKKGGYNNLLDILLVSVPLYSITVYYTSNNIIIIEEPVGLAKSKV